MSEMDGGENIVKLAGVPLAVVLEVVGGLWGESRYNNW